MMVTLTLRNLTNILVGFCFILVANLSHAKTQEVGAIGQIKGSGVLERGKDIVIDGDVGVVPPWTKQLRWNPAYKLYLRYASRTYRTIQDWL